MINLMIDEQVRDEFGMAAYNAIQNIGFEVKGKSKGKGASGYIIFEWKNQYAVKYSIQLTFTSYLAVSPQLNVCYKEVDAVVKKLDKAFAKNHGTATFNSYLFEIVNPANANGYLNESAGNPYYQIKEPYTSQNVEKQAIELSNKVILPALKQVLEQTCTLNKADEHLNKQFPIRPGRNRLLTSVLCNPIPKQMVMSLLIGRLSGRELATDIVEQYKNYVREEYHTENAWVFLLEKVISDPIAPN